MFQTLRLLVGLHWSEVEFLDEHLHQYVVPVEECSGSLLTDSRQVHTLKRVDADEAGTGQTTQ